MLRRIVCTAAIFSVAMPGSGCAKEIGYVSITATSIQRWESYSGRLQPQFELTAEKALEHVAPVTARIETKQLDATGASGAVKMDMTAPLEATSTKPELPSVTELPGIGTGAETIKLDPFAQYQLATFLFQEVLMLERYVRDAALPTGYRPYLVRLNVSLTARRRDQPYDAYTTISFFEDYEDDRGDAWWDNPPIKYGPVGGRRAMPANVRVVPLLITDSIESALRSGSERQLTELRAQLSGLIGNVGVSGDLWKTLDRLEYALTRRKNSLMTVARLAGNTIQVRIGAELAGVDEYVLTTRNRPVTLLVLVPKGPGFDGPFDRDRLMAVARTTFRDATSGEIVPPLGPKKVFSKARKLLKTFGDDSSDLLHNSRKDASRFSDSDLEELLLAIAANDFYRFERVLRMGREHAGELQPSPCRKIMYPKLWEYRQFLWATLADAIPGIEFSVEWISLPDQDEPSAPCDAQIRSALLLDDGGATTAVLDGYEHVRPYELRAVLEVPDGHRVKRLEAKSVEATPDRSALVVTFPSLRQWNLAPVDLVRPVNRYCVEILRHGSPFGSFEVTYQSKPKEPAPPVILKVEAAGAAINPKEDSTLEFQVFLTVQSDLLEDPALVESIGLRIDNGEAVRIESGTLDFKLTPPRTWSAKIGTSSIKNRPVTIVLRNFETEKPVELHPVVNGKPAGGDPLTLKIVPVKPAEQPESPTPAPPKQPQKGKD